MTRFYPVSVCVPVYRVEKYIERCAVSLFEQTVPCIEYVFVNDCTDDSSVQILHEVLRRYPGRRGDVRIISHSTNMGLAVARNTALENSSGEFIMCVDSDDYVERDAVERLLDTQRRHHSDIVFYNAVTHSARGCSALDYPPDISREDLLYGILSRRYRPHIWLFLVRREIYTVHNIRATAGINNGEDYLVTPRLLYHAGVVTQQDRELYHYDDTRPDSLSGAFSFKRAAQEWDATLLLEQFFSDKEERYREAVGIAKLSRLSNTIMAVCNGCGDRQDFKRYRAVKQGVTLKYLWKIPLRYVPLIILNNYTSACLYARALTFVKKCLCRRF